MDNPKVEVRTTERYGKSLFAVKDIPKDEVIADWTGGRIYHAERATDLPDGPPDFVRDHAIQFEEHGWIDYEGVGRYLAHSCDPNCGFKGRFRIVAMRDIKKGEELAFDYAMSEDSDWRMGCRCDSKDCRKIIGAYSLLPQEVTERYGDYISSWLREKYES